MHAQIFDQGQLLDLENDDVGEEEDVEDMELEGIDVVTRKKKNELCVVPQEHRLEVLGRHRDSQVAGHWVRHQIQALGSGNFIWDKWSEDVARYVAGCVKCQQSKADGHSRQIQLVPMPTEESPYKEIVMTDMQTLAGPGRRQLICWVGGLIPLFLYICTSCTYLDLQIPSEVLCFYYNIIYFLYPYVHPVRPKP